MTTYNTGNPVPSADARDRYDNSQTLDEVVNGDSASYTTRTGNQVISLGGMNSRFNNAQDEREVEFNLSQEEKQEAFQSFLEGTGWSSVGGYGAGVVITSHTQTVDYLGQPYSLKPSVPASLDAPYITTGVWATEGVNFKLVGDNSLRQDLADPTIGAKIVTGATRHVASMADLKLTAGRYNGDVVNLVSYHAGWAAFAGYPFPAGGGPKVWDAASVEADNFVTVIAVTGVATGRWKDVDGTINISKAGALAGDPTSQKIPIERADAVSSALNVPLWFPAGMTFYADVINLKSRNVFGKSTKLIKTASTGLGLINWGDKTNATGIVDGTLEGFELDGNGKDNVVLCRLYGNHTRSKVKNMRLIDSDFYAFSWGGLTSQGDKDDYFDGLELRDIYIASERGNPATSAPYSFGLEIFPGKLCKNLTVRNVTTFGKIINKIHWVDNLDMDQVHFQASSIFNSLGSGYCEINNCFNSKIGASSVFDTGGNNTYLALLIGGSRVVGGPAVTNFEMSGKVRGRVAFEKFADVRCTSEFKSDGAVFLYNVCGKLVMTGSKLPTLVTEVGKTGSVDQIILNGVTMAGAPRFDEPAIQIKEFIVNGGSFELLASAIRLNNVLKTIMNSPTVLLNGPTPLAYAFSVKDGACEINGMMLDGYGVWDRPVLVLAGGSFRFKRCSFNNLVSSNLLASGSLAITQLFACDVNNVAV